MRVKSILALVGALMCATAANAWDVPDETLHYALNFKWGFIDANMGIGTLSTTNLGNGQFMATLSGQSVRVLDHQYAAGDTIVGTMMADTMAPVQNEQLESENGYFAIETISDDTTPGANSNGRIIATLPNGKVVRSRVSSYGSGVTLDLLSTFYYMRQIDYESLPAGHQTSINLSGRGGVDNAIFTYMGKCDITFNGCNRSTYEVSVNFYNEESGKRDTLLAWISTDDTRVPLVVHGSLNIGHFICTLVE